MNVPVYLTSRAFRTLIANLVQFEEGFGQIIADFFPAPSKDTDDLKRFFNDYVSRLNNTIRDIQIVETAGNDFPYAIIGSEVVVKNMTSCETSRYQIVSPLQNQIHPGDISFLSPLGKVLLLKNAGDKLWVEAPGKKFESSILAIKIVP